MKLIFWLCAVSFVFSIACTRPHLISENSREPEPEFKTTPEIINCPIPIHIAGMSAPELCNRLISIDTLPDKEPAVTNPIYESLILKGDEAIPCLVENISDTTPIPDPRYSVTHWQHFAVGDTAVFILLKILSKDENSKWEKLMLEMLPPKYAAEWESNGVYAYFNYVSEERNRKVLRKWWIQWLKQNKKDLSVEIEAK